MSGDTEDQGPFPDLDPAAGLRAAFKLRSHSPRSPSTATRVQASGDRQGYAFAGEIARGGMGIIVKAFDRDLTRDVALKVLRDELASDPRLVRRFLEEARITARLDHPGVVPVHQVGRDAEGRAYFAMRLVRGRELRLIISLANANREGWNQTRALSVILKVCEAMAYAHDKGVIHRDLKPSNVMVGEFGEVYVMDWGLAHVIGGEDAHDLRLRSQPAAAGEVHSSPDAAADIESPIVTMDGEVLGTPCYMAPEQAEGRISELGPRSDVYAVGAMLYHLLGNEKPYVPPGTSVASRAVLKQLLEGPPRALFEVRRDITPELIAICERAMARDPNARYPGMLDMAEDLRAFLERRVVHAYETGAWAEAKKWVRRNKPLAASLAVAVLLLVAGLTTSLVFKVRADENATLAAEQAGIALANEQVATQRANDVLSLSAIQDLKDLEDRADALWPADPENVPKYEAWLADAHELIEGRSEDSVDGVKASPSLAEHEAKLAEIRRRAKHLTNEQVDAHRKTSPSYAEWEQARGGLQWMRRMLGEEPWPSESEVDAVLAKETLPTDANGLNELARPLVDIDPDKIVYGSEVRALLLAHRAVLAAQEGQRAGIRDTLAWALYRCGFLEEALLEEQSAVDEAVDEQKERLSRSLKQMHEHVANWRGVESEERRMEAAKLASRVLELERAVNGHGTWVFEDGEDRWWHAQLSQLVTDLRTFTDEKRGGLFSAGTSKTHGWGIVKRAEFARTIQERSLEGPETQRRWDEAIAAIPKSPRYAGLHLVPQLGLVPIGEDPDSHLWEFAHLATGEPAERGPDGKLVLREEQGLVFVLIAGATFRMGAQRGDPAGSNYDPLAQESEAPVHEVTLSPYFLSKYEMTQGQWTRFAGWNPSRYGGPWRYRTNWNREGKGWTSLHPVEQVSWTQCTEVMRRLGLSLPSEAQWENGARGGTNTVFWTGSDLASLEGTANLSDAYGKSHGNEPWNVWEKDFDDGNTVHAEVGAYRANPFGLHDVHGNMFELCRDGWDFGFYGRSPQRDPIAPLSGATSRVIRGGGFNDPASHVRVSLRQDGTPEHNNYAVGLRPARNLQPPASLPDPSGK